jgi:transcriptional regulator with XRE-family HTH domain
MRDSTMSRKKHDTTPVAEAAELAHGLLGEDDAKPVRETRADWIEVLVDTPARDSRHIFSPAVGNLVCERIAAGATLNQIASESGMPSRSTINRWCTDRPEFKRQYDIAVQLRADGLLEETIEIIDDKKEIVTETTTEDEDGTKRVSKAFTKEGLAYAMARINIRYKTLAKMLPRKWGDEGHGLGEPAPALEPPRNGDNATNMGNAVVLENHPLREEILAWQRVADQAEEENMKRVIGLT